MGDEDIYRGPVRQRTPLNDALCAIWWALWVMSGKGSGTASFTVAPATGTSHAPVFLEASASDSIPTGAKFWSISVISGTATIGGTASIPAGFSYSGDYQLLAPITVATASASSAILTWAT